MTDRVDSLAEFLMGDIDSDKDGVNDYNDASIYYVERSSGERWTRYSEEFDSPEEARRYIRNNGNRNNAYRIVEATPFTTLVLENYNMKVM